MGNFFINKTKKQYISDIWIQIPIKIHKVKSIIKQIFSFYIYTYPHTCVRDYRYNWSICDSPY